MVRKGNTTSINRGLVKRSSSIAMARCKLVVPVRNPPTRNTLSSSETLRYFLPYKISSSSQKKSQIIAPNNVMQSRMKRKRADTPGILYDLSSSSSSLAVDFMHPKIAFNRAHMMKNGGATRKTGESNIMCRSNQDPMTIAAMIRDSIFACCFAITHADLNFCWLISFLCDVFGFHIFLIFLQDLCRARCRMRCKLHERNTQGSTRTFNYWRFTYIQSKRKALVA
mmetsp:Transcript_28262/g.41588  ORF Transcript_28262/g.41588 Transcript_28262/m.41588 type:complete len:225 (-) Transcript_28262:8-682(-)